MRRNRKKNLISFVIVLFLCIGLGYAFLSANLNINGTAKILDASWDIHFTNLQITSGSVAIGTGDSAAAIDSSNNTVITYVVSFKEPGEFYEFTVDAKNFGTLNGMIESVSSKMNGVEIGSSNPLPVYLNYSATYSDDVPIDENHLLTAGSQVTYKVRLEYKKDIEISDLPDSLQTYSFSFEITDVQADENAILKPEWPVIGDSTMTANTYRSDDYREKIKVINLDDEINPPSDPIISWDIGAAQNGNVMAYITTNADDSTMYDLTIQGDGTLYANPDSFELFKELSYVDSINNINVLNTSKVTNMSYMFRLTGSSSSVFTLDLGDNFDTSNVTNMRSMFSATGLDDSNFTLDLGDKFDTSKVTNMSWMFYDTGYHSTVFTLNLGNKFDTSKVTDMSYMFYYTGYTNTVFTLDLKDKFNTSNVTNMSSMFSLTGYSSTVFTLDLGDKFDTSNVTNMSSMFSEAGYSSTVFTLDLGDKFDTSDVTNMSFMFSGIGFENDTFELDLSSFSFQNVTEYDYMFGAVFTMDGHTYAYPCFYSTQKIYVKDISDRNWILTHVGSSASDMDKADPYLTTANVLVKGA